MIYVSLALSQTPADTVRLHIQG